MTPWQNRVTDLTRRMADDMKLRNFSQSTIDAYTYHVGKFAEFLGKSPLEATAEDVRSFQLNMIEVRKIGWSSFNQAVCGLRFLFRNRNSHQSGRTERAQSGDSAVGERSRPRDCQHVCGRTTGTQTTQSSAGREGRGSCSDQ